MANNIINNYKTLPIGTIFTYNGNKYQVCKFESISNVSCCTLCCFGSLISCSSRKIKLIRGECYHGCRIDNKEVYYKQITDKDNKDMNKNIIPTFKDNDSLNDLHIDCPKGYSIDLNNSDLSKGIIKFKKDNITLGDIYENQGRDTFVTNVVVNNKNTYNKILAIAQLMDIAKYYNNDWKPDWNNDEENKYYIFFKNNDDKSGYFVASKCLVNYNIILFKNERDAQSVIDNPNFRDILDTIYKN